MKITLFKPKPESPSVGGARSTGTTEPIVVTCSTGDAFSFVQKLLKAPTSAKDEYQLLEILKSCSPARLNDILINSDLSRLFQAVDDRLIGPNYRTRLFEIISCDRINRLTVPAKAAVINALQVGVTCRAEEWVLSRLFCATRGADLTELKNLIDAGDSYHDLSQLIYHDIDDDTIRERILGHIAIEGTRLRDSENFTPELKVLSDIDDTVISMLYDVKLAKRTVYPGVKAFADALDAGLAEAPDRMGDKTFVSARPGILETGSLKTLHEVGFAGVTVQTGDVWSLRSKEAMGEKKVENFALLKGLYPEYNFVFTGDSGQGDVLFARAMRRDFADIVPATFIHDVWLKDGPKTKPAEREEMAGVGVFFFDTYLGAITEAFIQGLLTPERAVRAVQQTMADFSELSMAAFGSEQSQKAYGKRLARDLTAFKELLPESL
jgi:hypothetical protein